LRADIDYAVSEAETVYGKIGIKVWIFKGEVFGKVDLSPNAGLAGGGPGSNAPSNAPGGGRRKRGEGQNGPRRRKRP